MTPITIVVKVEITADFCAFAALIKVVSIDVAAALTLELALSKAFIKPSIPELPRFVKS